MAFMKRKSDGLIAGFLAVLTAFSPVASVVPVYAGEVGDGTTSSLAMDPDSVTVDETGSDGIVIENQGDSNGDGSDDGTGGITIEDPESDSDDGIQIEDQTQSDDGITIEDPVTSDDGIQIDGVSSGDSDQESIPSDDGIVFDPYSNSDDWDFDLDVDDASMFVESPELKEFSIDIRSIHGQVKLVPADADPDDLSEVKYVRILESDDGYMIRVTDGNGSVVYETAYDELVGVAWSEFVESGLDYKAEAIADDGYAVTGYSAVRPSDKSDTIMDTDFVPGTYASYAFDFSISRDMALIVNFGEFDSDKQVKEDGTGYVCAILTTGYEKKNRPGSSPGR